MRSFKRTVFKLWETHVTGIRGIEGWLLNEQDRWLLDVARWLPDKTNVLEIGAFKGRGTVCLGLGCLHTRKHVYALDTFCGNDTDFVVDEPFYAEWEYNIRCFGLSSCVTPCIGRSDAFYKYWTIPLHFLFIDGSHDYDDVLADYINFYPHVMSGGIIALHDVGVHADKSVGFEGPHRVWHELAQEQLYDCGRCSTLVYGRKQ